MFMSEWHEFPSAPCLAGNKFGDISRLDVFEILRVPDMLRELVSFLVGLRTYQHPGIVIRLPDRSVFLIGLAAAPYRAPASIIPGLEWFSLEFVILVF